MGVRENGLVHVGSGGGGSVDESVSGRVVDGIGGGGGGGGKGSGSKVEEVIGESLILAASVRRKAPFFFSCSLFILIHSLNSAGSIVSSSSLSVESLETTYSYL
jgi:hypothetical protein